MTTFYSHCSVNSHCPTALLLITSDLVSFPEIFPELILPEAGFRVRYKYPTLPHFCYFICCATLSPPRISHQDEIEHAIILGRENGKGTRWGWECCETTMQIWPLVKEKGKEGGLKCPWEQSHLRKFGKVVKRLKVQGDHQRSLMSPGMSLCYYPSSSQLLAGNTLWEAPQISKEARLEILGLLTKSDSCWHHCLCASKASFLIWMLVVFSSSLLSVPMIMLLWPFVPLCSHLLTPPLAGLETWKY